MVEYYQTQHVQFVSLGKTYEEAITPNPQRIKWNRELKRDFKNKKEANFDENLTRKVIYRPFYFEYLYVDRLFIAVPGKTYSYFYLMANNLAICVSGRGADKFSCYFADAIPDLGVLSTTQVFPRYTYHPLASDDLFATVAASNSEIIDTDGERYERRDNITDFALREYQKHYGDASITKDDIFCYTYGLLHQPDYRARFANNLRRELPRIPMAPDFWAFAAAGRRLAALHLDFEGKNGDVDEYPLEYDDQGLGDLAWRLERKKLKWGGKRPDWDQSKIVFPNGGVVSGIPTAAQDYVVNGRTPLAWAMDRHHIRQDKESGIVNDPNAWWAERGGPRAILPYLARLVTIAVETSKLVASLPNWE